MALPSFARDSAPLRRKRVVKLTPPRTGSPPGYVPGIENVPAGTPTGSPPGVDYRTLIENDPWYQKAIGDLSAQGIVSKGEHDDALRRAYAMFGENFDQAALAGVFGKNADLSWLDENTRRLAQEATTSGISTSARLNVAHQDQNKLIENSLAARGVFRSGSTGFQLGREQTAFTQAEFDARAKLADYSAGVNAALAASEQQRSAARIAAAQEAATRLGNTTTPTVPAVPKDPAVAGFPAAGGLAAAQGRAYGTPAPRKRPVRRPPPGGLAYAQGMVYGAPGLAAAQGRAYGRGV